MGGSIVNQIRRQLRNSNLNWSLNSRTAYCIKVQDKVAGLVGQKYTVGQELLQREWRVYLLRHNFPDYLVTIHDILPQQSNSICTANKLFSVVIEHIPYRLSDLGAIQYQEAVYILSCILKGYKVLKDNKIDFYLLDQNNICFNKKGKCKIWIHQNLYLVKPDASRSMSQKNFVQSVYYMMQERVSSKKMFFQKNLAVIKNLTIQYLLEQIERFTPTRMLYMESLKNLSSDTSRENQKVFQVKKSMIKNATPQKKANRKSPSSSLKKKRNQQSSYFQYMATNKKLSLAAKKKQYSLTENKKLKHMKSTIMPIQTQLKIGENSPFLSQIFVAATNSKRNETCSYPQLFCKPKSNIREGFSGESTKHQKHNITKLKFIYNNSSKQL